MLPNHVSWWDWLLIGVCLDEDWRFVTSSRAAEYSWIHKLLMVNRRTFPVDVNSPYAVKHMAEYLQKGGRLVLFPEGRISSTGSLMKIFDGTGFLIYKTHARASSPAISGTLSACPTRAILISIAAHPVTRALVEAIGAPLTGTSANVSGGGGCRQIGELDPRIAQGVDLILDAGPLKGGVGSTVVDVTGETPVILREGEVTKHEIIAVLKSAT